MDQLKKWTESLTIRFLWVMHATRLRATPDLCPPSCQEGHTYKWPCRNRFKAIPLKREHAHYDPKEVDFLPNDEEMFKIVPRERCKVRRSAAPSMGLPAGICTFYHGHEGPHSWVGPQKEL